MLRYCGRGVHAHGTSYNDAIVEQRLSRGCGATTGQLRENYGVWAISGSLGFVTFFRSERCWVMEMTPNGNDKGRVGNSGYMMDGTQNHGPHRKSVMESMARLSGLRPLKSTVLRILACIAYTSNPLVCSPASFPCESLSSPRFADVEVGQET